MIIATIQGKKEGGKHITVINGELVTGDEQQNAIDMLYSKISRIKFDDRSYGIKKLNSNEFFCYMEHPEKDIAGRTRKVLIVFDKNTEEEIIKKTIGTMELNYNTFLNIYNSYNVKMNNNIMLLCIGLGLGALAITITLKNKLSRG